MDDRQRVLAALRAVAKIREANEDDERRLVLEARGLGLSWEDIGQALKRTRSAVWQKYHDEVD